MPTTKTKKKPEPQPVQEPTEEDDESQEIAPKSKKQKKKAIIKPEPAESEKITKDVEDLNMNVELTKSQLNRGTDKKKKPRIESSGAKKSLQLDKIDSAFAISKQ